VFLNVASRGGFGVVFAVMNIQLRIVSMAMGLALWTAGPCSAQLSTFTVSVDGVARQALVYAPAASTNRGKAPVVFFFHGHGGNMQGAANGLHLETFWPEAIVVYMQGLNSRTKIDPQGLRPGWQLEAGQSGDRDLKFFDAALARIREQYPVDDTRIYVAGFSNGATFSYLLWSQRGARLAAIAAVAGRMPSRPTEARPLLHIGGTGDQVQSFEFQKQAIDGARQVDGATGAGTPCGPICMLYASTKGAPVMTIIHPGGHIVPPWGPDRIVQFFKQYSLNK
jgi:polyhydroxybutyrate depolymerase